MLRKFIVYSLSFIVLAFFASPAFAQTASNSSTVYGLPSTVSPTSPLYTDLIVHNLFHSFSCLAVGQSVIGQPCLTYQLSTNAQGMVQGIPVLSSVNTSGGVLGTTTSLIGALYDNRPVTTVDYLASISGNFGVVKEANAQVVGSGAQVLSPILALWQTSRNISYVLMIIIFLIIGLMILFRNKINPQTVITAQAALPGLVIGLIMITFSYFFAGLISDMAFVGTNVVGYYFSIAQRPADPPQNLAQDISSQSVLNIFNPFLGIVTQDRAHSVIGSVFDKLDKGVQNNLRIILGFITAQFFAPLTASVPPPLGLITSVAVPLISGGLVGADPAFFLSFVVSFIAGFVLLYAMLKLLLKLVSTYLTIIFLTISAPFQFLFAALPGRQGIATGWILGLLANVLAFPAVLAVFYFVAYLLGPNLNANCADPCPFIVSQSRSTIHNAVIPTVEAAGNDHKVVGTSAFPLLGGFDLSFIEIILAFGALVALPSIPDVITRTIGKISQAGQMIGQEIGASTGAGQRYAGQYQNAATQRLQGTTQGYFGERGLVWNPNTGEFERRVTTPGLAQIDRTVYRSVVNPATGVASNVPVGKTWDPRKWKIKSS